MPLKAKDIEEFDKIYAEAHSAGMAAVKALDVVPMVVSGHANQMDDSSPVVKQWYVADGVCGFASVHIGPANKPFAKYLVDIQNVAKKDSYNGGIYIWISDFGQSMQKKEAYARAFAEVIKGHAEKLGLKSVWSESRLD